MSYSYARHKKAHEELVAMINSKELTLFMYGQVEPLEFEFITWPNYSTTIKIFTKGGAPNLEHYAIGFHLGTGKNLIEYRDAYIGVNEWLRASQQNYGLVEFFQDIMDELPHGSGIDADWTLGEQTDRVVQFHNSYHTMDENGGYSGWLDFTVFYSYDFANRSVKYVAITMADDERMIEEECEECGGEGSVDCSDCDGNVALEDQDEDYVECEECKGEGSIVCNECGGSGVTEYDDLDNHREYLNEIFPEEIKLNE